MSSEDLSPFLGSSKYIDSTQSDIVGCAAELARGASSTNELINSCFRYVRDQVKHSLDFELNPVTVIASDVLRYGTGYCYAKSHLLAALLRANQVPAGLCYQRLTVDGDTAPFCLHGLNAVYLEADSRWLRLDPRGNKQGVDAQFNPPSEKLAFPIVVDGEADIPFVYAEPLSLVTDSLENSEDFAQVAFSLPDVSAEAFPKPDPMVRWTSA